MPAPTLADPKHWRDRAAEMRALSAMMTDTETTAIMLRLAEDYDKLADRAEIRSHANPPKEWARSQILFGAISFKWRHVAVADPVAFATRRRQNPILPSIPIARDAAATTPLRASPGRLD